MRPIYNSFQQTTKTSQQQHTQHIWGRQQNNTATPPSITNSRNKTTPIDTTHTQVHHNTHIQISHNINPRGFIKSHQHHPNSKSKPKTSNTSQIQSSQQQHTQHIWGRQQNNTATPPSFTNSRNKTTPIDTTHTQVHHNTHIQISHNINPHGFIKSHQHHPNSKSKPKTSNTSQIQSNPHTTH